MSSLSRAGAAESGRRNARCRHDADWLLSRVLFEGWDDAALVRASAAVAASQRAATHHAHVVAARSASSLTAPSHRGGTAHQVVDGLNSVIRGVAGWVRGGSNARRLMAVGGGAKRQGMLLHANQTRRALGRLIHSLVCAPEAGTAELIRGPTAPQSGQIALHAHALHLLMAVPLLPPTLAKWHPHQHNDSMKAYKSRLRAYETEVSKLISRASAQPAAWSFASKGLGLAANKTRAQDGSRKLDAECIATLLTPALIPAPPAPPPQAK